MRVARVRPVVGSLGAAGASLAVVGHRAGRGARPYWALDPTRPPSPRRRSARPGARRGARHRVATPAPTPQPADPARRPRRRRPTARQPSSSGRRRRARDAGPRRPRDRTRAPAPPAGIAAPALPSAAGTAGARPRRRRLDGDGHRNGPGRRGPGSPDLTSGRHTPPASAAASCPTGRPTADGRRRSIAACAQGARRRLPARAGVVRPDVVVGMVTLTDIDDRVWDDAEGPLAPIDQRFYDRLVAAYDAAIGEFLAAGVTRGAVDGAAACPPCRYERGHGPTCGDPARYDPLRRRRSARSPARHPGQVDVVDLGGVAGDASRAPPDRPDGLHWSRRGARQLADEFLGPVSSRQPCRRDGAPHRPRSSAASTRRTSVTRS